MRIASFLLVFLLAALVPAHAQDTSATRHEVQPGETVYSISRKYGISEAELEAANPQVRNGLIMAGASLNIPARPATPREEISSVPPKATNSPFISTHTAKSPIRVVVILPFSSGSAEMSVEAQKMTNFHQGFLLAVDSLKHTGCDIELSVYDETAGQLPAIGQNVRLVVGPTRPEHIRQIAAWTNERSVAHVVPLSNDPTIVDGHRTTFQVNSAYPTLYQRIYNRFLVEHKADSVIFVKTPHSTDYASFVPGLQKALTGAGRTYRTADIDGISSLATHSEPMVIVPSSESAEAFEELCGALDKMNTLPGTDIQLFGYPEWQGFGGRFAPALARYRAQFFTTFFSGDGTRTREFNEQFARWFNQRQYPSFPKYGEMGFDIGMYFLSGIRGFGDEFYGNIHNFVHHPIEFPLYFERKDTHSGFQNKSVLLVTYATDGTTSTQ